MSEVSSGSSPKDSFEFVIRFSTAIPDVTIPIPDVSQVSTSWLKKQIRRSTPSVTGNKRLKLIFSGRVLVNDTNYRDVLVRHSYESDDEDSGKPTQVYVHCLVGDELSAQELQKEDELDNKQPETSTTPAPVGFDRLLSQGFSQQDVLELRQQFQRMHGNLSTQRQSAEDIRQLEDRWIDSTVNNEFDDFAAPGGAGNAALGGSHDSDANRDLLVGILIGCFLGVFALFLLKLELGDVFNKRTRMAVVAGTFVNFSFGLVRAWS
ncbi:unnamed protein product [Kuraishia capsulata CBS 1993]|uniref:Ubiquitin-like domain-containing protein n=1 Tax=Kuraishia capsulata CBS 1993 TaxID=1382522 RepID=W6MFH6_9ASCO|nr:uncharacterized protein KUCA_T00000525001 [Kuraishia capsulata CBS 1993]CDK24559.1 unnamed protein product [Kuraishia capsulata CBS 1993]